MKRKKYKQNKCTLPSVTRNGKNIGRYISDDAVMYCWVVDNKGSDWAPGFTEDSIYFLFDVCYKQTKVSIRATIDETRDIISRYNECKIDGDDGVFRLAEEIALSRIHDDNIRDICEDTFAEIATSSLEIGNLSSAVSTFEDTSENNLFRYLAREIIRTSFGGMHAFRGKNTESVFENYLKELYGIKLRIYDGSETIPVGFLAESMDTYHTDEPNVTYWPETKLRIAYRPFTKGKRSAKPWLLSARENTTCFTKVDDEYGWECPEVETVRTHRPIYISLSDAEFGMLIERLHQEIQKNI